MNIYTYIFNISRVGASKVFARFSRVLRQLTRCWQDCFVVALRQRAHTVRLYRQTRSLIPSCHSMSNPLISCLTIQTYIH